jgi:hypothetical protein
MSRVANMTDLANRSLETSDPLFASQRLGRVNRSKVPLPPEVIALLATPVETPAEARQPRSLFQEEDVEWQNYDEEWREEFDFHLDTEEAVDIAAYADDEIPFSLEIEIE